MEPELVAEVNEKELKEHRDRLWKEVEDSGILAGEPNQPIPPMKWQNWRLVQIRLDRETGSKNNENRAKAIKMYQEDRERFRNDTLEWHRTNPLRSKEMKRVDKEARKLATKYVPKEPYHPDNGMEYYLREREKELGVEAAHKEWAKAQSEWSAVQRNLREKDLQRKKEIGVTKAENEQ